MTVGDLLAPSAKRRPCPIRSGSLIMLAGPPDASKRSALSGDTFDRALLCMEGRERGLGGGGSGIRETAAPVFVTHGSMLSRNIRLGRRSDGGTVHLTFRFKCASGDCFLEGGK